MLISVYIPTRNRAAMLATAIESVRRQTHGQLELIVVDDGSTDGTPSLLAGLAARDRRLRVITHRQVQGGAAARNAGILAARGDFVTGLDDDDRFTPDRLQRFAEAWRRHERAGRAMSALYSQQAVLRHGRIVSLSRRPQVACFDDMFRSNVIGNQIFAPRRHYLDAGLFRRGLPAWQDLEFFMRILKVRGPARLDDAATYHWDDSPRADRVSMQGEGAVRRAFATVRRLHARGHPRRAQHLYLQLFSRLYGLRPGLRDWREFLGLGLWPEGLLRMSHAAVRKNGAVAAAWSPGGAE